MYIDPVKDEYNRQPSFLALPDGRRLAYALTEGRLPGIVFLSGFRSDMTGAKAMAVEAFCRRRGQRCLRFDYTGHGQSSGDFRRGTIGAWKQDALDMLDHVAPGPNILVGSSMGGWLMLLAALERPDKVAGLVGIAAAPDFTEKLIWEPSSDEQKTQIAKEGEIAIPDCEDGEPYPIMLTLIEEGRNHLLLEKNIPLIMPVRLLHGTRDEDVPWQMSVELMERLKSQDTLLTLVKGGDHRMSQPQYLKCLFNILTEFLNLDY